jgi:hypothetical protein
MTRGRIRARVEAARECVEGDLASLGTARVLIHLVVERVASARVTGLTGALGPVGEDLARADLLINRVQARIQKRFEEECRDENDRI